jgi:hypothetical protein
MNFLSSMAAIAGRIRCKCNRRGQSNKHSSKKGKVRR